MRVVLDRSLRLRADARVFDGEVTTLVLVAPGRGAEAAERYPKCEIEEVDFVRGWRAILDVLYVRKVQSLFVEGGAVVLNSLIESELWGEVYVFVSPLSVAELPNGTPVEPLGIKAPTIPGKVVAEESVGGARVYHIKRKRGE